MSSRFPTFIILILIALSSLACETIHTGVLGDIPTGMKPSSALNVGDTYSDPLNRFSLKITDDRHLVVKRTKEGVVFEGKAIDRGDIIYAVLVYELPSDMKGTDYGILEATWDGLVEKARAAGGTLIAIDKQKSVKNGLPYLEAYYRSERGTNSLKRGYISRFVKKDNRVYNMYYSYVSMYQSAFDTSIYNSVESFADLKEPAAKFFEGVRFE
ncbi:MAG: hypothetical protein WDL87_02280 [Candidatus Omnitrophota bacterium]|jgi:hypothetical protein